MYRVLSYNWGNLHKNEKGFSVKNVEKFTKKKGILSYT